jgi:hypothetical protein
VLTTVGILFRQDRVKFGNFSVFYTKTTPRKDQYENCRIYPELAALYVGYCMG